MLSLRFILIFGIFWVLNYNLILANEDKTICKEIINNTERRLNIPKNLLLSIALTESGRKVDGEFIPWPWSINTGGKGYFLKNKKELINKAKNNLKNKINNFDLGCMQINYFYHGKKFLDLEQMSDPEKNILWSGKFLISLKNKHKNWKEAISRYHSSTLWRKKRYFKKVINNWAYIEKRSKDNITFVKKENPYVKKTQNKKISVSELDLIEKKQQLKKNYNSGSKKIVLNKIEKKNEENKNKTEKMLKEQRKTQISLNYQESVKELNSYIPKIIEEIQVINSFKYINVKTINDNLERIQEYKQNKVE